MLFRSTELSLRSDIADLQVQADRLRALLFAEPQILIAWAAGDNRPQISGDTSLLISQDAQSNSSQRILAFGTWLPPSRLRWPPRSSTSARSGRPR